MKLTTLFILALSLAAEQTSQVSIRAEEEKATLKLDSPSYAMTGWLYDMPKYVEIGGLDQNGKPYLIVKGKRKACRMSALIKAVKASKMDLRTKAEVLRYLGHPINVTIQSPEAKP